MAATVAVIGAAGTRGVEAALRACAVAGVASAPVVARVQVARAWRTATAVLVAASAQDWTGGVPRRPRVAVLDDAAESELDAWRLGVQIGAETVFAPDREPRRLVEWLALAGEPLGSPGVVVGVAGACGGAGASTFAAALALRAASSSKVSLLDADPGGGGIDVLLGIEKSPGTRWPDLQATRGVVATDSLAAALPRADGVAVLSWVASASAPLPVEAMDAVLSAAIRGSDLVVVDLPRGADTAAEHAVARTDHVVLVVPASVRAVAAGAAAVARWSEAGADVGLVVRHPGPADLTATAVAEALGRPLLGVVPVDTRLAHLGDRGRFIRAVRRSPIGAAAAAIEARLRPVQAAA
jgi:secretion/DNA translocation related CpaE-like protein